jgi:malonyl-CoA/methylmalonyl-CoA synthetase
MNWSNDITAKNLAELWQTHTTPIRIFAECDDGRVFTYGDFWALAGRFAAALKHAGAQQGDRIAVQVDKSIEALALFWACARGGFVFLPLNTAYTVSEVRYFIEDAAARIFICTPARETEMQVLGVATLLTLDDVGGGSLMAVDAPDEHDVPRTWDDLAAILYTSGTTGRSKGAMLSHGNLASNALALFPSITPTDFLSA